MTTLATMRPPMVLVPLEVHWVLRVRGPSSPSQESSREAQRLSSGKRKHADGGLWIQIQSLLFQEPLEGNQTSGAG